MDSKLTSKGLDSLEDVIEMMMADESFATMKVQLSALWKASTRLRVKLIIAEADKKADAMKGGDDDAPA